MKRLFVVCARSQPVKDDIHRELGVDWRVFGRSLVFVTERHAENMRGVRGPDNLFARYDLTGAGELDHRAHWQDMRMVDLWQGLAVLLVEIIRMNPPKKPD